MIAAIFAAGAVAAAQPATTAPVHAPHPKERVRMIVEQQLNSRTADSPPPPPESGAEASAVETRYLKSIGKPLSPPNDSMNSGAGGSGASGGYGGASTGLTGP